MQGLLKPVAGLRCRHRLYLLDAPFSSELLSLIRTLSITAVIASFTYHSCLRETFLKEQYSLPSYIILAGAFSWIAFHSIPNWFFPLYCIATTQLIFHSLGNGIRGVEISLLPAIVVSTLLFTIFQPASLSSVLVFAAGIQKTGLKTRPLV